MKKQALLSILGVVLFIQLHAQQLPLLQQHEKYRSFINPAFPGTAYLLFSPHQKFIFSGAYRDQWIRLRGPKFIYAAFDYFNQKEEETTHFFFGGNLLHYNTSPLHQTALYGKVGVRLWLGNRFYLSMALNSGVVNYQLSANQLRPLHADDPGLPVINTNSIVPNFGAGIFLRKENIKFKGSSNSKYYFGISVPQFFSGNHEFKDGQGTGHIRQQLHWYALAGIALKNNGKIWVVNGWGKYVQHTPFNVTLNTRFYFENKNRDKWFWLGSGISGDFHLDSGMLHTEFGFLMRGENYGGKSYFYNIGTGMDFPISSFGSTFGPSAEMNFTFGF